MEVRSVESNARGSESRSYSRSAMLTGEEEEELDYDEEVEQVEAPQVSTSGQAFRGERLSRRDVAANLSRGEGCVLGGTRSRLRVSTNVDVAIQAGGEGIESKVGDLMSAQEESAFRVSELLGIKGRDGILQSDVQVRSGAVVVWLRASKNDRLGRGQEVFLKGTGLATCPVGLWMSFARRLSESSRFVFLHEDGSLLTAYQLLAVLRRALGWLGMDYGTMGHIPTELERLQKQGR
ncbi:hypothetical protein NDU88_004756 [Pleurodeles waltl]|uniref:Uncharacterized protein n=1 Tax=Pleurodeles waltl TaxID=8319 RepID=A0AAV7VK28_PLEWA|nr:hypothetical protein NDU88_004756 [Pleurodeles waltl]